MSKLLVNFSFAGEYFFKVPVYTVITALDEPFSRPGSYYQIVVPHAVIDIKKDKAILD